MKHDAKDRLERQDQIINLDYEHDTPDPQIIYITNSRQGRQFFVCDNNPMTAMRLHIPAHLEVTNK